MDQASLERLEALLSPIAAERPAGEDLAYSPLFDQIREARRADDPTLARGEWSAALKCAEWPRVRQLCEQGLSRHSKDLQLAAWYAEALARLEGFAGLEFGLRLTAGLLERFWDGAYPSLDGDDAAERAGRLAWMAGQLDRVIREIALTAREHGGYDWHRYRDSREVDNLGLRDGAARERAIAEGRLGGEAFDRSARLSGAGWYEALERQLAASREAFAELDRLVEARFGEAAPSLAGIREALDACAKVCARLLALCGGASRPALPVTVAAPSPATQDGASCPSLPQASHAAPAQARAEAIGQLHAVARYFRDHEPHSPVALLVERAARWAEMPLEQWLQAVIKDSSTLGQLQELLDIRRD